MRVKFGRDAEELCLGYEDELVEATHGRSECRAEMDANEALFVSFDLRGITHNDHDEDIPIAAKQQEGCPLAVAQRESDNQQRLAPQSPVSTSSCCLQQCQTLR